MATSESQGSWDDRYHLALGRFIRSFTGIENLLFRELCNAAEIPLATGKALFSGSRADALVSFIRRCHEARKLTLDPLLERALQQTSVLNVARNDVVHLIHITKSERAVAVTFASNFNRTLPSRSKEFPVTPEFLHELADDADQVRGIIMARFHERIRLGTVKQEEWEPLHKPWRYKPPSPASSRPKSQDRAPKRERQKSQ